MYRKIGSLSLALVMYAHEHNNMFPFDVRGSDYSLYNMFVAIQYTPPLSEDVFIKGNGPFEFDNKRGCVIHSIVQYANDPRILYQAHPEQERVIVTTCRLTPGRKDYVITNNGTVYVITAHSQIEIEEVLGETIDSLLAKSDVVLLGKTAVKPGKTGTDHELTGKPGENRGTLPGISVNKTGVAPLSLPRPRCCLRDHD
jgi:hypothetical protein